MIVDIIQRPLQIFSPKATEVYHHTHIQRIHFGYQLAQVLNGHGPLVIVYIDERKFGMGEKMLRNL